MKKLISILSIAASLIFLTSGLAQSGQAIHYDKVVIGTGNYPDDINNVQAAVNGGGNILLKGIFNFGNWAFPTPPSTPVAPQRVTIKNDVSIFGETDKKGNPLTRINGGFFTFYSPLPVTPLVPPIIQQPPLPSFIYLLPDTLTPGPKITIQGIHFDGALWAPIHIAYTSGANISGNKITNAVPYGPAIFDPVGAPGFKFSLNGGIICGPWFAQTGILKGRIYREGAVTGQLKIYNNNMDLENSTPANTLGQGIYINWTTGVIVKISDNTINNVSRNSIEVLDNYLANGIGLIVMEDNEINTSQVGIPYPGPFTPNGIIFGWFLNPAGYDQTKNCLHTVMRNSIRIRGETSGGIMALADGSLILNNHIVSEGAAARGLGIVGSHGIIAHNKIEGTGNYAINVEPSPNPLLKLKASYNFFQGNNYNLFNAALYDLRFATGADNNVFLGHSGHVSDEGKDNRITNFSLMGKTSELIPKSFYLLTGQGRR